VEYRGKLPSSSTFRDKDVGKLTFYQRHGFPRNGDIFRRIVFPQLQARKREWDNLSTEVQSEDATFAECQKLCEDKSDCVQFSLTARTCKTLNAAKLGHQQSQAQPSDELVESGWIMERVERFMKEMDAACHGQDWIMP
jgi:hypothetical protein